MSIKIIRKPSTTYRAECPYCDALLEYHPNDAEFGSVKCPCCSNYIDHRVYGTPYRNGEDTNVSAKENNSGELVCFCCGKKYEYELSKSLNFCHDCIAEIEELREKHNAKIQLYKGKIHS